jgi:Flp pilus assembly protein TadD
MPGSFGVMRSFLISSEHLLLLNACHRPIILTSSLRAFLMGFCALFVCAGSVALAKTTIDSAPQTTVHHAKRSQAGKGAQLKTTSRASSRTLKGSSSGRGHGTSETVSIERSHGRRHHNLASRNLEEDGRANETVSRHGRHRRHNEVGKPSTRLSASKAHGRESAKPTHKHNSQEEAEAIEPPPIRVESESMARGYSRYDAGINKRLNGDYAEAISELKEARQIFHEHALQESPMETFAALELGRTADEAGNYNLARRTYEDLKSANPSALGVRLKLARLEAKHGEIFDALKEARDAVNLEPNSPEAHLMLSLILERTGSAMEAIVEKQRAGELAGGHL